MGGTFAHGTVQRQVAREIQRRTQILLKDRRMLTQTPIRSRLGKRPSLVTTKPRLPDPGDTLEFVQSLQSSLELEVMLPHLLDRIRLSVPGSRLIYRHTELNIQIELGGPVL